MVQDNVVIAYPSPMDTVISDLLAKLGVSLGKVHSAKYTIQYDDILVTQSTLELALIALIEKLIEERTT